MISRGQVLRVLFAVSDCYAMVLIFLKVLDGNILKMSVVLEYKNACIFVICGACCRNIKYVIILLNR